MLLTLLNVFHISPRQQHKLQQQFRVQFRGYTPFCSGHWSFKAFLKHTFRRWLQGIIKTGSVLTHLRLLFTLRDSCEQLTVRLGMSHMKKNKISVMPTKEQPIQRPARPPKEAAKQKWKEISIFFFWRSEQLAYPLSPQMCKRQLFDRP